MVINRSGSGGVGLERSCGESASDWIRQSPVIGGVELLEARLQRIAYRRHRHDTYAISLTVSGVQAFAYRGATHASTPGQVVVLHPDEAHDGHAGTKAGFRYLQLYVEPVLIFEAAAAVRGRACALPFVREPVVASTSLEIAIHAAFQQDHEPLAIDDLVVMIAEGLLGADASGPQPLSPRLFDVVAVERARQFLDAEPTRVVRSAELEGVTGLSRYALSRQFRSVVGTSPYRYSLMRRLADARVQIALGRPLADVALGSGFADQAHLTRMFAVAFGVTPGRYAALSAHA